MNDERTGWCLRQVNSTLCVDQDHHVVVPILCLYVNLPRLICSLLTLDHYFLAPPALYLNPDHPLFVPVKYSAFRPSSVRHSTLIVKLTISSILWLYRIRSCSHPFVLCFHRHKNAGCIRANHFFF